MAIYLGGPTMCFKCRACLNSARHPDIPGTAAGNGQRFSQRRRQQTPYQREPGAGSVSCSVRAEKAQELFHSVGGVAQVQVAKGRRVLCTVSHWQMSGCRHATEVLQVGAGGVNHGAVTGSATKSQVAYITSSADTTGVRVHVPSHAGSSIVLIPEALERVRRSSHTERSAEVLERQPVRLLLHADSAEQWQAQLCILLDLWGVDTAYVQIIA
jgi:hypothetical protein